MGQKLVKFSDLSGKLITDEEEVARVVIHEHPELGGSPVEIEVQADEARAVEKSAVAVALVEIYLPGDDEPRRVAMEVEAFDKLATDKPMSELLVSARPAKRAVKTREKRGTGRDERADGGSASASAAPALGVAGPPKPPAPSAASLAAAGLAEAAANVA